MNVQILDIGKSEFRKFAFDQAVSKTQVDYLNSMQAQRSALANKIFGFPWTEQVTVGVDFVIVKKQDWVDWGILAEPLASLIQEHFEMQKDDGITQFEENPELPKYDEEKFDATKTGGDAQSIEPSPLARKIMDVLENEINPMVASHGGRVKLVDVTQDKAFVRLEGGCHGCSSSKATLKQGVEVAIKRAVPQIQQVIDVTDHASGQNPFM